MASFMRLVTPLGAAVACSHLLMVVLPLLLLIPGLCADKDCNSSSVTVRVYNLLYSSKISSKIYEPVIAGFNASLHAHNDDLPANVCIEVEHVHARSDEDYVSYLKDKIDGDAAVHNKSELPIVLGPVGDVTTLHLTRELEKFEIVAFSPFTGSSDVRVWKKNLYFLTASPVAEVLALIRYAVSQLRFQRLGFMYLKGVFYGDKEYKLTLKVMSIMGRKLCGVFELDSSTDGRASDDDFEAAWKRFAPTMPQGVIVFGSPIEDTKRFLMKFLGSNELRGAYILIPSMLQYVIKNSWVKELAVKNFVPERVILTGPSPLANDNEYIAVRKFQPVMEKYLEKNGKLNGHNYEKGHFYQHSTDGELMLHGWITGEVLWRTLGSRELLKNRTTYMNSLYNQRRYVIDDLVIGDFGGECEGKAGQRGAACKCNQGGNVVYMKRMGTDRNLHPVKEGVVTLASSRCYTNLLQLYAPLNGIMFRLEDNPLAQRITEEYRDGASPVVGKGQLGQGDRLFLHELNSTSSATKHNMLEEVKERVVTAVFGVVDDALLSMTDMTFIDPIPLSPRLKHPGRNVLHLSPTIEQQIFVMVERVVVPNSWGSVHAIVRSSDARGIKSVLRKTFWALGGSLGAFDEVTDSESVKSLLPNSGFVLVIGLTEADITAIAEHLDNHREVRVFVLFFDVALLYSEFVKVFKKHPQAAERLLFATSLPHWADNNTTSETVQEFHRDVGNESKWTPLALLGYATARAMESVVLQMGRVNSEELINTIFSQSVIVADDMWYGPFEDSCSNSRWSSAKDCIVNYGATHISVWSMARVLNPSVPPVSGVAAPSIRYYKDGLNMTEEEFIGTIVGTILCLIALVLIVMLMRKCMRGDTRDNENAPKELTDPVTLIFTDIESSTAQWAAHPELMPDAVATHHRLIRTLISKYGCYEVKTVGDSFMIACKSPFAATQLACDLQRCFLEHDWKTDVFDTSYREFERQRAEDDGDYVPPTGHLDPDVYSRLWNGLRVRVGIHTGLCDIRHDEVTKGYDFYGRTSNMAARTESIANGGQVLLTRSTYLSLSTSEREQLNVTALGDVPLRGVPKPVEMYQLNAVPGRTFTTLRLDHEVADDEDTSVSCSDGSSIGAVLSDAAHQAVAFIEALLGAFPTAQHKKLLMPFCNRWGVSLPYNVSDTWDATTCRNVTRLLAARVGRVVDFGTKNTHDSVQSFDRRSGTFPPGLVASVPEEGSLASTSTCIQSSCSVVYMMNGPDDDDTSKCSPKHCNMRPLLPE
ncbi:receptor-type adenylate cyclase GRESAG 4, putative [Trypanosoma brucei brucei TREU927]|uniref:adenylate cyclase n=1 Tax=Trypanosoma brucei brucei (strain 927/4 GUTat10.1) TaxID=185431 RepID=Q57U55_TRYB2|nr:receptor-type adenylate cyclase GRESAG 4, putative [Trypanosoma brucei brucei TREU927]AAX70863.1 receptor-type adenylate cyclase GRESAG 4, putative [Trypanosoma brucei]AAZ13549.1 receptor-type adenylate cyclase GRESAG 4, putative [Trypanosoma brucei brucei TREU927]